MNSIWKRRRNAETRLTLEGWVYLIFLAFITIGSILRNVNLLVLMAGLLYAPLILHWRASNQLLRKLRATRNFPQRLHAGKTAKLPWTVKNDSDQTTAWNVMISDQIVRDTTHDLVCKKQSFTDRVKSNLVREEEGVGQAFWRILVQAWNRLSDSETWRGDDGELMSIERVEGGQSRTGVWRVIFPVRGRYEFGPARLVATSPFGLLGCFQKLPQGGACYVAPALGTLSPGWVSRLQSICSGDESGRRRRGQDQEEFYALRPWRSGDAKKHIHWRTTARYGLPIVKQFDQKDDRDVALVLDLYCPALEEVHDEEVHDEEVHDEEVHDDAAIARYRQAAEVALSFATTVVSRAKKEEVRGRITLGVCGQRKVFFPGRQADFIASVMKALAVAQPASRPLTAETLLDVSSVVATGTPIFVISTRAEADLMLLAPQRHQTDAGLQQVSHKINAKRLQRIQAAVHWSCVDSARFRSLFSMAAALDVGSRGRTESDRTEPSETERQRQSVR